MNPASCVVKVAISIHLIFLIDAIALLFSKIDVDASAVISSTVLCFVYITVLRFSLIITGEKI